MLRRIEPGSKFGVHELREVDTNDITFVCVDVTGKSNEAKEFDLASGNAVNHVRYS